jgi:hypothetical protein
VKISKICIFGVPNEEEKNQKLYKKRNWQICFSKLMKSINPHVQEGL